MKEQLKTLEEQLSNDVYRAALVYETAEGLGIIRGNGHHMAQALAKEAVDRLHERAVKAHPELAD
jgi:hypothetical protein